MLQKRKLEISVEPRKKRVERGGGSSEKEAARNELP
jgi:hypothetical protein